MPEVNEVSSILMDANPSNEATGRPPLPPEVCVTTKNNRKRSMVWDHFTELDIKKLPDGKRRATCNYCGIDFACETKLNGTGSMLNHLEHKCKKYPLRNVDKKQTTLGFKPIHEGDDTGKGKLVAVSFSAEACRQALAEMVIIDELPFSFVEGEGFRKFMFVSQPKWTKIPSRVTIAKDCYDVFLNEKKKLKSALKGQRICLTTDTWTSVQNLNYMCLTAHFIDSDWTLHKRILNFCLVESHKGEILGRMVETCLLDWGIDKILTLTVDNASSNNGVIDFLKKKTKQRDATILGHEFLHVRCCAHILNLIVRDGLKDVDDSIVKIRNAVRYVRSSPQRYKVFMLCAVKEKITHKHQVCLDVPTRWNYTYKMLDRAEKFQKAFERLEEDDLNFCPSFREECDGEGDDGGNARRGRRLLGPPDNDDWEKVRLFVKFLKLFHDATLRFSGTKHLTCNTFIEELMCIQETIDYECNEGEFFLQSMASNMKAKFLKYWGNFDNMNALLYCAVVLDPRYKIEYLDYSFGSLYDIDKTKQLIVKIERVMERLFDTYKANYKGVSINSNVSQSVGDSSSSMPKDVREKRKALFKQKQKETKSADNQSELERYLKEATEDDVPGFDVLAWWSNNSSRFRVLSLLARHVLAIPISTVASESTFSTAGRVIDPFRSSMSPKIIEALICAQNWIRSSSNEISLRDALDYVEELEKLESELVEEGFSLEVTPTVIEDDED